MEIEFLLIFCPIFQDLSFYAALKNHNIFLKKFLVSGVFPTPPSAGAPEMWEFLGAIDDVSKNSAIENRVAG